MNFYPQSGFSSPQSPFKGKGEMGDFRHFFLWGVLVAIFLFVFSWLFGGSRILLGHKDLLAMPWPNSLEFAGERVPLEDFYVREAWEKEFLVSLDQDYQNLLYLKRSGKFFPLIESELKKRGLPDDLKYLAVAESGLRENATSSANAAGIWQFIPSTGRKYGLRVDDLIDERRHFERSTVAALTYLAKLYDRFGSWTLTAAAYNRGENGITRDLAEQQVESYYDLDLNNETSRYLFRILAIKQIMENPADYGYELAKSDYFTWPKYKEKIARAVSDLVTFAKQNGTTLHAIKELNPWIVGDSLPGGDWIIRIPK